MGVREDLIQSGMAFLGYDRNQDPFFLDVWNLSTSVSATLGQRGSGKSYLAGVIAEELLRNNYRIIVFDPMGIYHTLRERFDVEIIDASEFKNTLSEDDMKINLPGRGQGIVYDFSKIEYQFEIIRIAAKIMRWIYAHNNQPLLFIVDEADMFAPQTVQREYRISLDALENLCRRGRVKGIGVQLISQRAAVLNKNVLTQADIYFFFRVTHPRDVDVVTDIIRPPRNEVNNIRRFLPALKMGHCIVFYPSMRIFKAIRVRERYTSHPASTPTF